MKKYLFVLCLILLFSGGCSFFQPSLYYYVFKLEYKGHESENNFENDILAILTEVGSEMDLKYLGKGKYPPEANYHIFYNERYRIPIYFDLNGEYIEIAAGQFKSEYFYSLIKCLKDKLDEKSIRYIEEEKEVKSSFLTGC